MPKPEDGVTVRICDREPAVAYDSAAPKEWLRFLSMLWPDQQSINCLQEFFGLRFQKIAFQLGPGRSGKARPEELRLYYLGRKPYAAQTVGRP